MRCITQDRCNSSRSSRDSEERRGAGAVRPRPFSSWVSWVALIGARVLAVPHAPRALGLPTAGRRPALVVTDILRVPDALVAILLESSRIARLALVPARVAGGPHTVVAVFLVASLPLRVAGRGSRKNRRCHEERGQHHLTNRPASHASSPLCVLLPVDGYEDRQRLSQRRGHDVSIDQPDLLALRGQHRARAADDRSDRGALAAARDTADHGAGSRTDAALLHVALRVGARFTDDAFGVDGEALAADLDSIE